MADSNWMPVLGAGVGAIIALAGTLVSGVRTDRTQRSRDREQERLKTYIEFAEALEAAHAALRAVTRRASDDSDRAAAIDETVYGSGVYSVRERLLMSGTAEVVAVGENAFTRLVAIRDVIRGGAVLSSPDYHDAYHAYAETLWTFRIAARKELGQRVITPGDLGRVGWSERERCPVCGQTGRTG